MMNIQNSQFEPKTVLLDDKIDVKSRLIDLKKWQNEAAELDRQLINQLAQLEIQRMSAASPHIEKTITQKQALIGIIRKRSRILKIKVPYQVSIESVQRIGFKGLFQFLATQYVGMTRDERRLWLNNLFFLMTPDVVDLYTKIMLIMRRTQEGEQRNLLVGGDSGSGKTHFMNWFSMQYMPIVENERNFTPVIQVEPIKNDKTSKSLLQQIVLACGSNYVAEDTVHHLFNKIGSLFQICGVRLVMVDELNHLTDLVQRRRLLEVSNRTVSTSIVGAAVDPLQFRNQSPEIQGRFNDYFRFRSFRGEYLSSLLSVIELLLPFSTPSYLPNRSLVFKEGKKEIEIEGAASFIEQKTNGHFRYIMTLIKDAAELAIDRNMANITYELLRETWGSIQSNNPDEGEI